MTKTMNEDEVMEIVENAMRAALDSRFITLWSAATPDVRDEFMQGTIQDIREIEFGDKDEGK